MQLSYIKIFVDCLESIEPLDDAERGRLFTALLEYAKTGEKPVLQGNERFLFPSLRAQLDRDAESYEKLCEQNRRNGALGGQTSRKRAPANGGQDKDKEKEEDEDQEEEKEIKKEKDSSRQASGLPPALGRRPKAGAPREKNFSRKKGGGGDSSEEIQKDFDRMERFLLQLRREREEMDRAEQMVRSGECSPDVMDRWGPLSFSENAADLPRSV